MSGDGCSAATLLIPRVLCIHNVIEKQREVRPSAAAPLFALLYNAHSIVYLNPIL